MSPMTALPPTGTTWAREQIRARRRGTHVIRGMRLPALGREDIDWEGGTQGAPLVARLTLRNESAEPTDAVVFWIGVADFGAFLPHRPLRTLVVPSLAPGERRTFTAVMPGVQADDAGRVAIRNSSQEAYVATVARVMIAEQARMDLDSASLMRRLQAMVGRAMGERVFARMDEYRHELADALAPRGALNVAIMSPDREIVGERHLCSTPFLGWVRRGEENPMSFWVAQRSDGLVMELGAISEGWSARLDPGAFGDVVQAGHYTVWVTPPTDAKAGRLCVDVRDRKTGAVCPVEWRWEDRA